MNPSPTPSKTFVLHNPVAGTSDRDVVQKKLHQVMAEHQIPYDIHETTREDDPHEIVQTALQEGYERFLAVGGDGTVSGVASGLAHTNIPVVIIPTGTGNSLANVFGIPFELDKAVRWWLATQRKKTVDMMKVQDRFYVLNVSAGLSSKTMAETKRQDKRKYGLIAYWVRGLQRLMRLSSYKFWVEIDGGASIHFRAEDLVVANSGIIQFKPLQLDPDIRMDDGKISVCYVRVNNIFDIIQIAAGVIAGRPSEGRKLACRDAVHEVRIRADKPIPVQADGELVGSTPVTIELAPAAVSFLVPEGPVP